MRTWLAAAPALLAAVEYTAAVLSVDAPLAAELATALAMLRTAQEAAHGVLAGRD